MDDGTIYFEVGPGGDVSSVLVSDGSDEPPALSDMFAGAGDAIAHIEAVSPFESDLMIMLEGGTKIKVGDKLYTVEDFVTRDFLTEYITGLVSIGYLDQREGVNYMKPVTIANFVFVVVVTIFTVKVIMPRLRVRWLVRKFKNWIYGPFKQAEGVAKEEWDKASQEAKEEWESDK